jgi:hypothetical protein
MLLPEKKIFKEKKRWRQSCTIIAYYSCTKLRWSLRSRWLALGNSVLLYGLQSTRKQKINSIHFTPGSNNRYSSLTNSCSLLLTCPAVMVQLEVLYSYLGIYNYNTFVYIIRLARFLPFTASSRADQKIKPMWPRPNNINNNSRLIEFTCSRSREMANL